MASVLDPHYLWAFGHLTVLLNAGAFWSRGSSCMRMVGDEVMRTGMRGATLLAGSSPTVARSISRLTTSWAKLTLLPVPLPLTSLTPAYIVFQTLLFRGTPNIPYRLLYVGALLSYSIVVFKSLGKPPGLPWGRRAFVDENAQYALLAFYW